MEKKISGGAHRNGEEHAPLATTRDAGAMGNLGVSDDPGV